MTDLTIRDIVDIAAQQKSIDVFAFFPETKRSLSFDQLNTETQSVHLYLDIKNIPSGAKIGVMMRNGEEIIKIMLGIMRSGRVAVPINPNDSVEQAGYIVTHSNIDLIFVLQEFKDAAYAALEAVERDVEVITVDRASNRIFEMDIANLKENELMCSLPALLLHTSGSTGSPKGVLLSHRNLLLNAKYVKEAHLINEEDRALCILPLFHINGFVFTLLTPLLTKSKVVMPYKFHVKKFWQLISSFKATWVSAIPTILSFILHNHENRKCDFLDSDCSLLRFVRSASMMLPIELHKNFEATFDCMIIDTLGITEATGQVFSNPCYQDLRKYGSVGLPYGNKVKIIDGDGNEIGDGVVGDIVIKGDSIMLGYYKEEVLTREAFIDGWFKTGDMGYRDKDGYYFITGRKKEVIIRGGENISPVEIDNVLYRHPAIREAAAVGVPDEYYGEEIKAFVVLKRHTKCAEEGLIKFCRQYLPEPKVPKSIEFRVKLPKGPSGKILRLRLAEESAAPERELQERECN